MQGSIEQVMEAAKGEGEDPAESARQAEGDEQAEEGRGREGGRPRT